MRADSRFDKGLVVHKIVEGIRSTGGRFLKKDRASNRWDELSIQAAKDKVAHAIRDAVSALALRKSKEDLKPAAVPRQRKRPRDAAVSAAAAYPTGITSHPQAGGSTEQFYQDLESTRNLLQHPSRLLLQQVVPTRAHTAPTDVPSQHPQAEAEREDRSHSPIPFHGQSTSVRYIPEMMRMPDFAATAHYAIPRHQHQHQPSTQLQYRDITRGFQMRHPSLAVATTHNEPYTVSFRQSEQKSAEEDNMHYPFLGQTTDALHLMMLPPESATAAHGVVTAQLPTTGAAPPAQQYYQGLQVASRGLIQVPLPPQHHQQQRVPAAAGAVPAAVPYGQPPTVAQEPGSYDSFIEDIESVLGPLPPGHEDAMDSLLKSQQRHDAP